MEKELNIIPFVCEALATEEIIYEYIDRIYEKDKDRFYNNAIKSEFYFCSIVNKTGVIVKHYFRKLLGIMIELCDYESSEENDGFNEIKYGFTQLIKTAYRKPYNFVQHSGNNVNVKSYYNKLFKAGKDEITSEEEMNRDGLIIAFLCNSSNKVIENEDFLSVLYNAFEKRTELEINKNYKINISNISKGQRKKLNEIKQTLKNRKNISLKLPTQYRYKAIRDDYSYIKNDIEVENEYLVAATEDLYYYNEFSFEANIFKKDLITERDVDSILYSYVCMKEGEIDYSKLELYYHYSKQILYFIKLLKRERKFCEEHFSQGLEVKLIEKENELSGYRIENKSLSKNNDELLKEIEVLKRENKRLKKDIEVKDDNRNELIALREYLFKNKIDNEISINYSRDYSILNAYNVAVFGGSDAWQSKMRERLNSWKFISCDAENFDTSVLANVEYIIINASFMGHGMYYKIVSNANRNKIIYLNNKNIEICLDELYTSLLK